MKQCALTPASRIAMEPMVVGPPLGMTGIPSKPPSGAFGRRAKVLSDWEKAM